MKVTLIASTEFHTLPESVRHSAFARRSRVFGVASSPDELVEFAGRACYQSWELPNPATAENAGYVANIVAQEHFSVMEHASATFYIEGVSRALTHELIRHRHLSYSELSQRYVDVEDAKLVYPPAALGLQEQLIVEQAGDYAKRFYRELVGIFRERGMKRKQAREAARAVMPNATETKIVVTGNLRAWRDFLKKRWHVAADAEIRELAGEILRQLRELAPASFADVPEQPYGTEVA